MEPKAQINIVEKSILYDISMGYHSDMKCENYDAIIRGVEEPDGKVTIAPHDASYWGDTFTFKHSDPDRVIAVAQMMLAFAQMVKKANAEKASVDSD